MLNATAPYTSTSEWMFTNSLILSAYSELKLYNWELACVNWTESHVHSGRLVKVCWDGFGTTSAVLSIVRCTMSNSRVLMKSRVSSSNEVAVFPSLELLGPSGQSGLLKKLSNAPEFLSALYLPSCSSTLSHLGMHMVWFKCSFLRTVCLSDSINIVLLEGSFSRTVSL